MEFVERYVQSEVLPGALKEVARDPEIGPLVDQLVCASIDYSTARAKLKLALNKEYIDAEERAGTIMDRDRQRKQKHDVLVDAMNILSRSCKKRDIPIDWREEYADRGEIGDFAAKLVLSIPVFTEA